MMHGDSLIERIEALLIKVKSQNYDEAAKDLLYNELEATLFAYLHLKKTHSYKVLQ